MSYLELNVPQKFTICLYYYKTEHNDITQPQITKWGAGDGGVGPAGLFFTKIDGFLKKIIKTN